MILETAQVARADGTLGREQVQGKDEKARACAHMHKLDSLS